MKISGTFCEQVKAPKSAFDKRSFRWTQRGQAKILVGCPKGEWQSRKKFKGKQGACAVGTRAHVVLTKARGRCEVGRKIHK